MELMIRPKAKYRYNLIRKNCRINKQKNGCKAIAWDQVLIENILLAAIIVGSIYFERWLEEKARRRKESETKKKTIILTLLMI